MPIHVFRGTDKVDYLAVDTDLSILTVVFSRNGALSDFKNTYKAFLQETADPQDANVHVNYHIALDGLFQTHLVAPATLNSETRGHGHFRWAKAEGEAPASIVMFAQNASRRIGYQCLDTATYRAIVQF